eukprot:gene11990-8261_t
MSQLRKFASQYVSQHLNGLTIASSMDAARRGPVIATHNGSFHCDEALACGLLRHLPAYAEASVIRTRDAALIDQSSIVVDVGAVYDHGKLRYDHHQSSFHGTMATDKKTYTTRLSSAGLVYEHYGRDIIRQFVQDALSSPAREEVLKLTQWGSDRTGVTEEEVAMLFDALYRGFVEAVDAIDNGVDMFHLEAANTEGEKAIQNRDVRIKRSYNLGTDLGGRIGSLHTWWNDPRNRDVDLENASFAEAMEMAATEFFQALCFYAFSWLPGRALVAKAFEQATTVHPSGKIIVFEQGGCPWKDHLFTLEEEHGVIGRTLYALFSDGRSWRVQAVPQEAGSFANRKSLPFRGLRDEALSEASGIPGGVFVHVSGFIGGMTTYEGALALAVKARHVFTLKEEGEKQYGIRGGEVTGSLRALSIFLVASLFPPTRCFVSQDHTAGMQQHPRCGSALSAARRFGLVPTPTSGSRWSALRTPCCNIIVPRQLKAYGGSFSPSIGERNAEVASHLVLQSLSSPTRLANSPLLRKPVKTSCVESFEAMLLAPELRDALRTSLQITTPSPIQQSAVETILQRRTTLLAAPHGEGKTLAFLLPLFQLLMKDRDVHRIPLRERRPRMLLLAPTRETVQQLHGICEVLCRHTGLTALSFTSRPRSKFHLSRLLKQRMADIVVMDPKLLLRLIRVRRLFLDDLRYVAVDEADALLSSTHDHDTVHLLAKVRRRNMYKHLWPVKTQVVFSTAYITRGVEQYVGRRFPDVVPCFFKPGMHQPPSTLRHEFYPIRREADKMSVLLYLLRRHGHEPRPVLTDEAEMEAHRRPHKLSGALEDWQPSCKVNPFPPGREREGDDEQRPAGGGGDKQAKANIAEVREKSAPWEVHAADTARRAALEGLEPLRWQHLTALAAPFTAPTRRTVFGPGKRTIVFMRHIDAATAIFHQLRGQGYAVSLLHAALPPKVRREMYADFCAGRTNILCATDLAARGLDTHVDLVINFDMPTNALTYLSRAGRTSRMGRRGRVCSLYTKFQGTVVNAIKAFVERRQPLEGITNNGAEMSTPRYAEWRTHKIDALSRAYVSMITNKAIPAHLERSYVHHNVTWRPLFHPQTIKAGHAGVPPRQQQRIMDRAMFDAVQFRRRQMARRKGGRAKFGSRDPRRGVWNDVGDVRSAVAAVNMEQSPNPSGVGPPSGPPSS